MRTLLLVIVFLLSVTSASHASLTNWTVDMTINDDGGTEWVVALTYNETVPKSDYFVFARVSNLEEFGDSSPIDCVAIYSLGTSIVCSEISAREVVYKFHVKGLTSDLHNFKIFRYPFSVTQTVERMQVTVKFPLGAALVEDIDLAGTGLKPFEPDFGRKGSDGRRIFVGWTFDKPTLGQSINIYAIYEVF